MTGISASYNDLILVLIGRDADDGDPATTAPSTIRDQRVDRPANYYSEP